MNKKREELFNEHKDGKFYTFRTTPEFFDVVRDVRSLAIYHFYKSRYFNSTIYNFSYSKVAKDLKISFAVAKKCIDELIRLGFASKYKSSLTFTSSKKVGLKFKTHPYRYKTVKIAKWSKFKDIIDILYTISLDNYSGQQKYVSKLKLDIKLINEKNCKLSYKRIKKLIKVKDSGEYSGKREADIIFSSRRLSKKWGVSHSKAAYILNRLQNKKLIIKSPNIEKLAENYSLPIYDYVGCGLFGYMFVKNNSLFLYKGTNINYYNNHIYTRVGCSNVGSDSM